MRNCYNFSWAWKRSIFEEVREVRTKLAWEACLSHEFRWAWDISKSRVLVWDSETVKGPVLMSVVPVATEGHAKASSLGLHLVLWWSKGQAAMGSCQSGWSTRSPGALVTSRPLLLIRVKSGSMVLPQWGLCWYPAPHVAMKATWMPQVQAVACDHDDISYYATMMSSRFELPALSPGAGIYCIRAVAKGHFWVLDSTRARLFVDVLGSWHYWRSCQCQESGSLGTMLVPKNHAVRGVGWGRHRWVSPEDLRTEKLTQPPTTLSMCPATFRREGLELHLSKRVEMILVGWVWAWSEDQRTELALPLAAGFTG